MATQMNADYATALRQALIEHVEAAAVQHRRIGLRMTLGIGAGVLAVGGGVAAATGWLPLPGSDVVTPEAPPVTVVHTGSATIDLGPAPHGATDIELKFTCLSAGSFTFQDGASVTCSTTDAKSGNEFTTYKLALAPGQHSTTITATEGARWTLTATYAHVAVSNWGVNQDGQTFGVANEHGFPDLVAVIATNGRTGYAYSRQLNPPGPTTLQTGPPKLSRAPTIPVYTSDGHTQIGVFK